MSLRFRINKDCTEEERAHAIAVLKSYALPQYKLTVCAITKKICKNKNNNCAQCAIARKNGLPVINHG